MVRSELSKLRYVLGADGESAVSKYLERRGFTVICKNYVSRFGEIDIIAERGELLIFVEVKTRKACYFPVSMVVTRSKQKKIIKTAKMFLLKNNISGKACRFDVATVLVSDISNNNYKIDYIKNCFMESL